MKQSDCEGMKDGVKKQKKYKKEKKRGMQKKNKMECMDEMQQKRLIKMKKYEDNERWNEKKENIEKKDRVNNDGMKEQMNICMKEGKRYDVWMKMLHNILVKKMKQGDQERMNDGMKKQKKKKN